MLEHTYFKKNPFGPISMTESNSFSATICRRKTCHTVGKVFLSAFQRYAALYSTANSYFSMIEMNSTQS